MIKSKPIFALCYAPPIGRKLTETILRVRHKESRRSGEPNTPTEHKIGTLTHTLAPAANKTYKDLRAAISTSKANMSLANSTTLAAAMIPAAYLVSLCGTSPNPSPDQKDRHTTERLGWIAGSFAVISRRISLAIMLYHVLLTILPTYAPAHMAQICPNPEARNPALFTWSATSASSLALIYFGTTLRLSAYGGLGQYFTFHLAAPGQLVTTGVYRWVQHPSYAGILPMALGSAGLFLRWDATPACWVAEETLSRLRGCGLGAVVAFFVLGSWGMMARVRDEEEMLKQHFGKEWEEWHAKTGRFIPGIL